MLPAQLPPVDPEFLISVRDAEKLDAYARGLREASAPGNRKGNYPVNAAVCWLIDAYAQARVPLSPSMSQLIRQVLNPNAEASWPMRGKCYEAYRAAIEFEAATKPDAEPDAFDQNGMVKPYRVAKHLVEAGLYKEIGAAQDVVSTWHQRPEYRSNVEWQRDPRAWALTRK